MGTEREGAVVEAIRISERDLERSVGSVGLDASTAHRLWQELRESVGPDTAASKSRRLDVSKVLFYGGGGVALVAMSVFMGEGWASWGHGFGLFVALFYTAMFAGFSALFRRKGWTIPAGIMATVAVALVPLVVFAFENTFGLWHDPQHSRYHDYYPWISASWVSLELATIVVGSIVVHRIKFGLVLLPVGVATWFLSMDATRWLFGRDPSDAVWAGMAIAFGMAMISSGRVLDRRGYRDIAFWPHLFGLFSISGGLGWLASGRNAGWFIFVGVASIGIVALSILWDRTTYLVIGAINAFCWLGQLASDVFRDNMLFPLVLALIGVGIMSLGVPLARRRDELRALALNTPASDHSS